MARQILTITTEKTKEEIREMMNQFLVKNGYRNKKYGKENVLIKNTVPGFTSPQYMKIYAKDNVLKVEAWIKAFGTEYGIDNDFVACVPKKELKTTLNSIANLFQVSIADIKNENSQLQSKENGDGESREIMDELQYELIADMKTSAIISTVLGVIMLLVAFIPFPIYLALILTISGIVVGISGLKSSLKALAIIGIVLSSIDTLIFITAFIFYILQLMI